MKGVVIVSVFLAQCVFSSKLTSEEHTRSVLNALKTSIVPNILSFDELHLQVETCTNTLMNASAPQYMKQQNFILSLYSDESVGDLKRSAGLDRLKAFGARHYLLSMKPSLLQGFLSHFAYHTIDATPLLPIMKLSEDLVDFSSKCLEDSLSFIIEIAALEKSDLHLFIEWMDGLAEDTGLRYERDSLAVNRKRNIYVTIPCQEVQQIIKLLSEQPEVIYIERKKFVVSFFYRVQIRHVRIYTACLFRVMRSFNYWVKGVEESGSFADAPIRRTLGLTGNGQVIGIADTGLDFRSGYFPTATYR